MTVKRMTTKKTTAGKTVAKPSAMHSSASPDWATPMLLRRFAQRVLRPAALSHASIDLDYATSAYWQSWWPDDDRPAAFLDGSKGRDVLVEADRRRAAPHLGDVLDAANRRHAAPRLGTDLIGAGFMNAPGLNGGDMVQQCWGLFEEDHRTGKLGSGFWQGYSVEQFGSLQNIGERNPLTCTDDHLITTIVPSRRAHYVVHPEQLIAITKKKQKKRERGSKEYAREQKLLKRLRARTDDAPVDAGAPSHLSYTSILWHRDRDVRRAQMEVVRSFLKEQQAEPKSLLHKFEVIGPLELEAR